MFSFFRRLAALALGLFGEGIERVFGFLVRRDFAQERAEAIQLEADAREATANENVTEARHTETTSLIQDQLAESRALRKAIERAAVPTVKPKSRAERRKEIADMSAAHDPVIRSSTWVTEPEDDDKIVVLKVA